VVPLTIEQAKCIHDSLSCGSLLLCAGMFLIRRRRNATRSRSASLERVRPCLSTVLRDLSDGEFQRVLRMQWHTFSSLLNVIRPDLERDTGMALRSSGGRIEPEIRLALTLRLLAGASYLDAMMLFGISRSFCYVVFHSTVNSILSRLDMSGLPFDDISKLNTMSRDFTESRAHFNSLVGCVGAIDGIAVKIAKPRDNFVPRNDYCRKGFYSVPFQVVDDAKYRSLLFRPLFAVLRMILLPSAPLALDRNFITQACPPGTGLLATPPTFARSLYWFHSRECSFSMRTKAYGGTRSIFSSPACVCTSNKRLVCL
jgi:hypothetical protein